MGGGERGREGVSIEIAIGSHFVGCLFLNVRPIPPCIQILPPRMRPREASDQYNRPESCIFSMCTNSFY